MTRHIEWHAALLKQTTRDICCHRSIDTRHGENEFVTAQAGQRITTPYHIHQAQRDGKQQIIADTMTERIVDPLEMVKIEAHQCDIRFVALCCRQQLFDPIMQQTPVGQLGQDIKIGQFADFFLGQPLAGHIEHCTERGRSPAKSDRRIKDGHRDSLSVLAKNGNIVTFAAGMQTIAAQHGMRFGKHQIEEARPTDQFTLRITKQIEQKGVQIFEKAVLENKNARLNSLQRRKKIRFRLAKLATCGDTGCCPFQYVPPSRSHFIPGDWKVANASVIVNSTPRKRNSLPWQPPQKQD